MLEARLLTKPSFSAPKCRLISVNLNTTWRLEIYKLAQNEPSDWMQKPEWCDWLRSSGVVYLIRKYTQSHKNAQ